MSYCSGRLTSSSGCDRRYGYRPAIGAIIERLSDVLAGACWDMPLEYAADSTVACIDRQGNIRRVPDWLRG